MNRSQTYRGRELNDAEHSASHVIPEEAALKLVHIVARIISYACTRTENDNNNNEEPRPAGWNQATFTFTFSVHNRLRLCSSFKGFAVFLADQENTGKTFFSWPLPSIHFPEPQELASWAHIHKHTNTRHTHTRKPSRRCNCRAHIFPLSRSPNNKEISAWWPKAIAHAAPPCWKKKTPTSSGAIRNERSGYAELKKPSLIYSVASMDAGCSSYHM